jgi:triacylglycerol lipase
MTARTLAIVVLAFALQLSTASARAADPPLTVPAAQLSAALKCPSSFVHRSHEPVLLVHGTGLTAEQSWSWNYAHTLPAQGYDTCTVTLPDAALSDIQVSSEYVVYAIEHIAATTGGKVDVITHSQGGMEGRWAMRWWPTARGEVDDMVMLGSPNHGIYASDACVASGNCWPAVWQMAEGAAFIKALNSGSETPGSVSYTDVYSLTDELVQPASTVPLRGGANTSNVSVQSVCPGRYVHHAGLLEDAAAGALVMDALTHAGPADPARVPLSTCAQALMPGVSPADAASGNATLYGSAAQAFTAHPGTGSEPPPAPYVSGG